MEFRRYTQNESQAIASLFTSVFATSEGDAEGALIGQLVQDLFEKTDQQDLDCFIAIADGDVGNNRVDKAQILGAIIFSRLAVEGGIEAVILAPVAVHSDHQGKGIGQALINHGLSDLRTRGVKMALTYGDPRFYGKVGFRSISPEAIIPPFTLSQPEGWLGQSLADEPIETVSGTCECVDALSDPKYW